MSPYLGATFVVGRITLFRRNPDEIILKFDGSVRDSFNLAIVLVALKCRRRASGVSCVVEIIGNFIENVAALIFSN